MNEQVATPEAPPAETTNPEATGVPDNATADPPPVDPSKGLLESAGSETTPSFTPDPAQVADPSKAPSLVERPETIAEQFWDPVKGEVRAESLAKAYNDSRAQNNKLLQQLDGKGEAPETSEDYLKDYRPPVRGRPGTGEKEGQPLERFGELDAQDPVIVAMSKAAKNANLSKGQFDDFMQDIMEGIHPLLPEPFNGEKELASLGENGAQLVKLNKAWIDRLASNGVLNETEYNLMLKFGATADGVMLTNKLRIDAGEKPIPVTASVETGRKTPDECQAMVADPRYHKDGPEGDSFRAEVTKQFALTYGTDPA